MSEGHWPGTFNLERFGAPAWAPRATQSSKRYFRGEVTDIDEETLTLVTDRFGDHQHVLVDVSRVLITPGWTAVRAGSKVEIEVNDDDELLSLKVLPFSTWLSKQSQR